MLIIFCCYSKPIEPLAHDLTNINQGNVSNDSLLHYSKDDNQNKNDQARDSNVVQIDLHQNINVITNEIDVINVETDEKQLSPINLFPSNGNGKLNAQSNNNLSH